MIVFVNGINLINLVRQFNIILKHMNLDILSKNENSEITSRVNTIIIQINELINKKNLQPGDRLPPERELAEKFGVSRRSIHTAILKLESYGILQSIPQSGTFIPNIGSIAMNGMIEDLLGLGLPSFKHWLKLEFYWN